VDTPDLIDFNAVWRNVALITSVVYQTRHARRTLTKKAWIAVTYLAIDDETSEQLTLIPKGIQYVSSPAVRSHRQEKQSSTSWRGNMRTTTAYASFSFTNHEAAACCVPLGSNARSLHYRRNNDSR
jgi:hypothetical protein